MAIYNGRILMRKGNEADFDASKLMSGEWAVSLDSGIIRICLEAGKVIRMATYEAFEEDMKQVEAILLECQSIEEAVRRINTEVNNKLNACAEYVQQAKGYSEQAKQYRDEALQFRNEAEQFAPEGYAELKEQVNENTFKIDTVIAKADLGIKETASGEEIHLTDSAEGKAVEFALYGKAKQNTTTGKNKLDFNIFVGTHTINMQSGIIEYKDGNLKAIKNVGSYYVNSGDIPFVLKAGTYTLMAKINSSVENGLTLDGYDSNGNRVINEVTLGSTINSFNGLSYKTFTLDTDTATVKIRAVRETNTSTVEKTVVYEKIMLLEGTYTTEQEWEEYSGGMASPNPDYPQEIEVSGESGSVTVKSVGKNLFNHSLISQIENGVTITVDETIKASGTTTAELTKYLFKNTINPIVSDKNGLFIKGSKTLTGMTYRAKIVKEDGSIGWIQIGTNGYYVKPNSKIEQIYIQCNNSGTSVSVEIEPQIVEGNVDLPFEPYKETLVTIPTENGLCGIKVTENGNYTDQNGQQWICDEVVKYADGSGAYIQRVKKVVYDGVNKAFTDKSGSTKSNIFFANSSTPNIKLPLTSKSLPNVLCSCFKGVSRNDGYYNGFIGTYQHISISNTYFSFGLDTKITTLELANAWLLENPMTLYYALAEPITTPLTAEELAEIEKLHTFYPITNISNDFECGMRVKYNCDSKNYIDKHLAEMEKAREQAMMNMFLLLPEETQATMIENDVNNLLTESEN